MRELQPFTSHRDRLRAAVLAATTGVSSSPPAAGGGAAEMAHFLGRVEAATFKGLLLIVRSLADVRGRKAVVFFDADHELGGGEIGGGRASHVYEAAVSDANRANVTIHTVDVRGLTASRVGGRSAFDQVIARSSAAGATRGAPGAAGTESWTASTEPLDTPGPMLGDPDTLRGVRDRFLSYKSGSLLEHVAEETGGLAIRNTNDLAGGLARVIDELREYYEVVYTPPNPVPDGRFRRIRATVTRPGVRVRTRAGYFATPATTPTVNAFEPTLIAALAQDDPPRTFPHEVRLVPHGEKDGDREVELLAQVPLGAVEIATDAARGTCTAHLAFVAFVRDETGRAVVRLSQDWPVEEKLDEAGGPPRASLVLRRVMSLPPGRYTIESAVQDRRTGRISVVRTPVVEVRSPGT
jgi:VWFA-related protein